MKSLLINILSFLLLATLINCAEEEVTSREYPRLTTLAVTDITSEGATFNAEFKFRGDFEILNYGFVWGSDLNPRVETSERIFIEGDIQSSSFSKEIITTLLEGTSYHVRAFVKTEEFIVYGINQQFVSLGSQAPKIEAFFPQSGTLGDTILIKGKNFSYVENQVFFEDHAAQVVSSTDTSLNVVVPDQLCIPANTVSVSVKNNKIQFDESFQIVEPDLLKVTPSAARTYDTLKIQGRFIGNRTSHIKVNFEQDQIDSPARDEVISNTNNEILVVVPEKLKGDSKVFVTIAGMTDSIDFKYRRPEIISINESEMSWGDTLIVDTQNFYRDKTKFKIFLNSLNMPVLDASDTSFSFIIPKTYKEKESLLFAEIAGFNLELNQSLLLKPLKIINLSTDSLAIGDMVSIELENLHPDNNEVFFNNIRMESSLTSDLKNIKFKMPLEAKYYKETMTEKKVKISIRANNVFVADTILPFKVPRILSISEEPVEMGEEVVIKGLNFDPETQKLQLMGEEVEIKSSTNSEIRFIIPNKPDLFKKRDTLNRIPLEILLNESLKASSILTLKAPIITDISPSQLENLNDIIKVTGINFGSSPVVEFAEDGGLFYNKDNKFEINNSQIQLISHTDNEIQLRLININLQNDKISQYFKSGIKIKSYGLQTESSSPIFFEHKTNWQYLKVDTKHDLEHNRIFRQTDENGFVLGGYKRFGNDFEGLRTVYQLFSKHRTHNENLLLFQYPAWNNSTDSDFYRTYIANAFLFQDYVYVQTSKGKIRRADIKTTLMHPVEWKDAPIIGNYQSNISAQFEHNSNLYLLSDRNIVRVSASDTIHSSTFDPLGYRLLFSKKVNDDFFLVIENVTPIPSQFELHRYNITNDFWELLDDNYKLPSEKTSRNTALVDYLFDEKYVYDYDFITGSKSIRFEFPETFTSQSEIELLFKMRNVWYFNISNEQYLIYYENQ